MTYFLTLWLFWTPLDAELVTVVAASCEQALTGIITEVARDGVRTFLIVSCDLVQEV